MPQNTPQSTSFDDLWQSVIDNPIQDVDHGQGDDEVLAADALVAWLRQIAEACHAGGLITDDEQAELTSCNDTFARVLGAIPPEKFRETLLAVGNPGD